MSKVENCPFLRMGEALSILENQKGVAHFQKWAILNFWHDTYTTCMHVSTSMCTNAYLCVNACERNNGAWMHKQHVIWLAVSKQSKNVYLQGIILASGEDAHPERRSACAPFNDCIAQLNVSLSRDQIKQKSDFTNYCQMVDSLHKCLDDKNAATKCPDDESLSDFTLALPICQPPHRQGISIISWLKYLLGHYISIALSFCKKFSTPQ